MVTCECQSSGCFGLEGASCSGRTQAATSSFSCAGQAKDVFLNMEADFMKPVISIVDELLEAGVNVTVYNGQLDLIVDTMGRRPL